MDKNKDYLKEAESILNGVNSPLLTAEGKQAHGTISLAYSMLSIAKSLESIDNNLKRLAIKNNSETFGSGIINL